MDVRQSVGEYGERVAEAYLIRRGWRILDRRWRCRLGELDLVALDGACLVACEVKTRRWTAQGEPVEAVTRAKLQRLRRLLGHWLRERGRPSGMSEARVDVIGVLLAARGPVRLRHVVGAL